MSGAYVIEDKTDEECQGNLVTHLGKFWGLWYDDTTPDLEKWVKLGVKKYAASGAKILVAVAPHDAGKHYTEPSVISIYEWYPHAGSPDEPPAYDGYCVQWLWPGPDYKGAPTIAERASWLVAIQKHHPKYIFLY